VSYYRVGCCRDVAITKIPCVAYNVAVWVIACRSIKSYNLVYFGICGVYAKLAIGGCGRGALRFKNTVESWLSELCVICPSEVGGIRSLLSIGVEVYSHSVGV
jgi:hypothetical protein